MGEPVVVKENPSSRRGVVRFTTDRLLTGMGHERYRVGEEVWGERPPDVLARRIFARGGVDGVQVHGNMITVDLEKGHGSDGLLGIIENMYVHYPENQVGDAAVDASETPVVDAPAVEALVAEALVVDTPVVNAPVAETSAVEVDETVEIPAPVVQSEPDAG